MAKNKNIKPVMLTSITIKNYKGIDSLKIDFPEPVMENDPYILAIGSQNGLGKTSLLECCAIVLSAFEVWSCEFEISRYFDFNLADLLIRVGSKRAEITGVFKIGDDTASCELVISKDGKLEIKANGNYKGQTPHRSMHGRNPSDRHEFINCLSNIVNPSPNPSFNDNFLFFNSYRKVQEGNPELGMLVKGEERDPRFMRPRPYAGSPTSLFKLTILRLLMGQAGLFESFVSESKPSTAVEKLSKLVEEYAGGKFDKLRPYPDNTIGFRIELTDGKGSFPFDGLSSGQKEIISTLFLIWHQTLDKPCVVMIDEPELHLNAEWHRSFVKNLTDLAPKNQYIIATHSESIMESVEAHQRVLLVQDAR